MLVSIVTPAYQHSEFIGECIRSVLGQSWPDWEMIVVDDGSTDGTAGIAESFGDPRIKVIRQENKGLYRLAETYNAALAEARGSLVAVLEGDDWWPSDKLESQVPDFGDPEIVLSSGLFEPIKDGESLGVFPLEAQAARDYGSNHPVGRAALHMLHPHGLTFTFPVTVVMRRDALLKAGGFLQPQGLPLVDYPTFLAMTLQGRWVFHQKVLGYWRRHSSSATLALAPSIWDGCHEAGTEFSRCHHQAIPAQPTDWESLNRAWEHVQLNRLVELGRLKARLGRHVEAAACFQKARGLRPGLRDKAALPLAQLLSRLRLSPEAGFLATGTAAVRRGDPERSGDSSVQADMAPDSIQALSLGPPSA